MMKNIFEFKSRLFIFCILNSKTKRKVIHRYCGEWCLNLKWRSVRILKFEFKTSDRYKLGRVKLEVRHKPPN